jgi:hypothetical protein
MPFSVSLPARRRVGSLVGPLGLICLFVGTVIACGSSKSSGLGGGDDGTSGDDDSGTSSGGGSGGGTSSGSFGGSSSGSSSTDAGPPIPITVTLVDTCTTGAPSGLSAASVKSLLAGGSAGTMRFLYPYASTIFPRGLIAPTVMWDGASADYVYVHLKSNAFEYKGCLVPTATGQILLPQNVWVAASSHAAGEADPFSLSLTTISSGTITGPITEPLIIAPATLKGSIYYNSYTTKLNTSAGGGGAVLRIVPGQNVTLFLGANGCTGCHAVSANGSRLVADPFNALNNGAGSSYALTTAGTPNPTALTTMAVNGTFVGLYPDGSLYVGNAHPDDGLGGPRAGSPGYAGPVNSGLFETDTGNAVSNSGIPTGAMMPMFSPDGKNLAFVDTAIGNGNGQGIATMGFDFSSRTASGYKKLYQVSDSSTYPGWPFYLPDNGGLVFAIGNQSDFSGGGLGLGLMGATSGVTSDLYMLDVASGTSMLLANAVGFTSAANAAANKTYLPYSATDELHHNFYPTVSPVAAGGYFWVFFDSYRHYGNQGLERQLWGTAVTVSANGKYTTDASHAPFYVTGQEPNAGNHRAFTALDPCQAMGATCTEGEDCCGGFCTNGTCGMPPTCSNTDDACSATQKCCNPAESCIGGYCAIIIE